MVFQVSESGSSEGVSQDPEVKAEELNQNIRKAEVSPEFGICVCIDRK